MMNRVEGGGILPLPAPALWEALLDLLFPSLCLGCGAPVQTTGTLCAVCWKQVRFVTPPWCERCGRPFGPLVPLDRLCINCRLQPPLFRRARGVMAYDGVACHLVLGFKHADRTQAAPAFGRWMARAGADLLATADLIVPVPLHANRLAQRRYNQAALLSHAVSRWTMVPVAADLLQRHRMTPSQGHLGRTARRRNVAGAFRVRSGQRERLSGRTMLLVDDVMTTGATVEACARALLQEGAAAVDVLTLAQVFQDD